MAKRYWLFKTEPNTYSWDDLVGEPEQTTCWEGVRNYQARNLLRDQIKKGDLGLFYHSSTNPQCIMGTCRVVTEGYPDPFQFDPKSKYFDEKSDPDDPRWFLVDVKADKAFKRPVTLPELKEMPELEGMMLLRRGARLSVQPVSPEHFKHIVAVGRKG